MQSQVKQEVVLEKESAEDMHTALGLHLQAGGQLHTGRQFGSELLAELAAGLAPVGERRVSCTGYCELADRCLLVML